MFGPATLTLLSLLLLVSLLAHYAPLFLLALALLLAAGLSKVWERYCLTGLEFRRRLSRTRAAFGETVELELELVNRKLLPLAWLGIEDEIPHQLPPTRGRVCDSHKPARALLTSLIALRPYERVRRHYPIPCLARGEHVLGPVRLRTGDLFGLVNRELALDETDTLVVYPRVVPLTALGLPSHQPIGERRTRSWLFEDPSRIAGVREHRPGDNLRRIHWPASVRTQRLQTKVYEPTTSHKLLIFVNLSSVPGAQPSLVYDPDALELTISTAASIAAWAVAQRYQVGLSTNGLHHFSRAKVSLEPSRDPAQLPRLLEALGRLQPIAGRRFEDILAEEARRLPFGTTVVVVSAVLAPPVAAMLLAMSRRGHAVTLVFTGRQAPNVTLDGVAMRRVGPPEAWRELATLSLDGA